MVRILPVQTKYKTLSFLARAYFFDILKLSLVKI